MTGAELAFEQVLDFGRFDLIGLRFGVKLLFVGGEENVDASGLELGTVVGEGARVLVEVLVGAELQSVD